jgi:hypothetical protein
MLSPARPEGAGARTRSGALVLCLALAGSLAAAPPSAQSPPPPSDGARAAPGTPATADPDATLQRLAEEAAQIDPSSSEALARLRTVVRDLIDVERATRREMAALRAELAALRGAGSRRVAAPTSSRRMGSEAPPGTDLSPAAGGAARSKPAAVSSATPTPSGALFGKRGLKKLHRAGCTFGERIKAEDRVTFASMQEAAAAGYEACKVCRPE